MRNYSIELIKRCPRCGKEFSLTGGHQKYCSPCSPLVKAERKSRWRKDNPEKAKVERDTWRAKNPEKVKAGNAAWREKHPESVKTCNRNSKMKRAAYYKVYQPAHPEQARKQHYKRRGMGFVPLNAFFLDSEAHHVDSQFVIYLPKDLHKSVRHCLKTGKNMEKINALAGAYLMEDCPYV